MVDPVCLVEQGERAVQVALGFPQPSRNQPRPVGVLRQALVFTEALADRQVFRGRRPVVAFEQDLGDCDVHVGSAAQELATGLRCGQIEGPLIGAQGVVQPALGAPDVADGDAAAEHVGQRSVARQPVDGFGIGGVRGGEVTGGPGGESGDGTGRGSGVHVIRRGQRQSPLRVRHGAAEVRLRKRERGAKQFDARRERPPAIRVDDDQAGRWLLRPAAVRRSKGILEIRQPPADLVEIRHLSQRADEREGKHRPDPHHLVGKRANPPGEFGLPPFPPHHRHRELHQVPGAVVVLAGQGMTDRLRRVAVGREPAAGPPVQFGHLVAAFVEQVRLQDVGEQVVVAIPLSPVVERDQEQVRPFERHQDRLAARRGR